MASDKLKQGDKSTLSACFPQSNEELEPFHLQDGTDDLAGIFDNVAQPATFIPTGDVHGMPQSNAQEMSFPVIKDDISQCNVSHNPETGLGYLYEPVSGFSDLMGSVNEFGQYHALGDSVAAANIHTTDLGNSQIERNTVTTGTDVGGGLQMLKAGEEANDNDICRPWLIENQINHAEIAPLSGYNPSNGELGMNISQMCTAGGEANGNNIHVPWVFGNQFIHAGSTPFLGHDPIKEELRMNNSFMAGVAQSNHPEMLDGKFLTLGYESNMETRSKYKVSSKDNDQISKKIALPMLNTNSSQNVARSSLNSSSNVADGFSSFRKHDGGFTRLVLDESDSKRIGHAQHDDGFSSLGQNASWVSHQAQNIGRSSGQMQNVGGLSKPSGDGSVGTQLPLVDKQHYNHIPSSWNLGLEKKWEETFANTNPHTSFQDLPTKSLMPHNSNKVVLPDTGWFEVTGLSPSSSLVRSTIQPASDQLHVPHVGAVRNFLPNPFVVSPFSGVARSTGWQNQSAGHPVQSNKVSAAKVTEGDQFSKNIRVKQANEGNLGQSQASAPVKPSALAYNTGLEIPAVNRPPQSSSVPSGPSLKRTALICPPSAPQFRCKKTRSIKPASLPAAPTLLQTGPLQAPLTSVDSLSSPIHQTVPSRPPLARTSPRLPSLPRTSSPHHIKWKGRQGENKNPQPSGKRCHICKRDLSFTPKGPIYQPEKPITVAVLPCGHHFHDSCLQRITPLNQAQDPPCIPCAMSDKD
ncbi:uncharacterized protein LOC110646905 isoform X3 [Hevea brasiliensis]|nr:uncharacterized protein LOC110646905 isoform X3 [Hevea brasiliensis]